MKQWFVDGVELEHALEKDFSVSDFESAVNMFTHLGLFISVR